MSKLLNSVFRKCLPVKLDVCVFELRTTLMISHEPCCHWMKRPSCEYLQTIGPVNEIIDFIRFSYAGWPNNIRKII